MLNRNPARKFSPTGWMFLFQPGNITGKTTKSCRISEPSTVVLVKTRGFPIFTLFFKCDDWQPNPGIKKKNNSKQLDIPKTPTLCAHLLGDK